LLRLLAQTASAPAPFDPTAHDLFSWAAVAGVVLVSGLVLLAIFHRLLKRQRLRLALLVALIPIAVYSGALRLEHAEVIFFWLGRALAAALIFAGLQLADRLIILPLLTRGGTVSIPRFFHQIVSIILAGFAILMFGSWAFGWDIDRFLAGSAVVSIVLGLALQETLGNFFSGLVMQASPPLAIGDWIICGAHEGKVVDMTWRAVTLHTNDDNFIHIPNATIAKAEVINYNAPTTATARSVKVGLESDVAPADAIDVLKTAALETPGVLPSPAPSVYLEDFGDAVGYRLKFWVVNPKDHLDIEHAVRVHVWYRLRERGFILPNPVRTIEHISQASKERRQSAAAAFHRSAAIESVPLLAPLQPEQKKQLVDLASEVFLTTGQVLFRQGDAGDSFYIIYKGQVEVLVAPEGKTEQRVVATLKPGDFFGEMSALTGQPRTATIRATAPLSCVLIEKRDLLAIFEKDPGIMEHISEIVARRNIEREAILAGAGNAPAPEVVTKQQKNLLGRMMSFFGLAKSA